MDIWSLGATLYMMVCGQPPWLGRNELELSHQIELVELRFPQEVSGRELDPHVKHLIRKMLVKDASKRCQLHQVFDHDWVTQEGSDPIDLAEEDFIMVPITKQDIRGAVRLGSVEGVGQLSDTSLQQRADLHPAMGNDESQNLRLDKGAASAGGHKHGLVRQSSIKEASDEGGESEAEGSVEGINNSDQISGALNRLLSSQGVDQKALTAELNDSQNPAPSSLNMNMSISEDHGGRHKTSEHMLQHRAASAASVSNGNRERRTHAGSESPMSVVQVLRSLSGEPTASPCESPRLLKQLSRGHRGAKRSSSKRSIHKQLSQDSSSGTILEESESYASSNSGQERSFVSSFRSVSEEQDGFSSARSISPSSQAPAREKSDSDSKPKTARFQTVKVGARFKMDVDDDNSQSEDEDVKGTT